MHKLIPIAAAALALAGTAGAAGPQHFEPFTHHDQFVDDMTQE